MVCEYSIYAMRHEINGFGITNYTTSFYINLALLFICSFLLVGTE